MKILNSKFKIQKMKFLLWSFCLLFLVSCYTFVNNNLDARVKTVQIKTFPNNAALVNATLSQDFTTLLQNRFLKTNLKGAIENPDLLIEGEITDYSITPTAISNPITTDGVSVQAAQNKLTITVKVHYENKIQPEKNFDRTYTDEATFSSDLDINSIETSQVKIVNDRIINKIFNDIVADW